MTVLRATDRSQVNRVLVVVDCDDGGVVLGDGDLVEVDLESRSRGRATISLTIGNLRSSHLHVRNDIVGLVKDHTIAMAVASREELALRDDEDRLALVRPWGEASPAKRCSVPDQLAGVVEDRGAKVPTWRTRGNEDVAVVLRGILDEVEENAEG